MIFKMINMKQKCDLTTVQLSRIATSIKIQVYVVHILHQMLSPLQWLMRLLYPMDQVPGT